MAHYKGAASEGTRAMNLMKKREKQREELERLKQKISEDHAVKSKFETIDKYSTHYDAVEEQLKSSTIGLVTLEEMKEKRETLVREREKQIAANAAAAEIERERKRKRKQVAAGTLSFNMDEDEEEEEEEEEGEGEVGKREDEGGQRNGKENDNLRSLEGPVTIKKIRKNPEVDTSFLPDRDREEAERREREKLRQEWVQKQETIKNEEIHITYSYWDGSGHRRQIKMKKGETIRQFLQKCLENLRKEFTELRATSVDNLMYIKEDLIIPQHHSFYDFIVNKARGKSGPLFSFDVHEDIRLVNDAGMEKDESHAGKVVLRSWYERNKHIFPASRWEPYDPHKKWEKYTISDNKK